MCIICGTPDPNHDLLLLRAGVVTMGTGAILAPRSWLGAVGQRLYTLFRRPVTSTSSIRSPSGPKQNRIRARSGGT